MCFAQAMVQKWSDNVLCSSEGAGVMGFPSEDALVTELPNG